MKLRLITDPIEKEVIRTIICLATVAIKQTSRWIILLRLAGIQPT